MCEEYFFGHCAWGYNINNATQAISVTSLDDCYNHCKNIEETVKSLSISLKVSRSNSLSWSLKKRVVPDSIWTKRGSAFRQWTNVQKKMLSTMPGFKIIPTVAGHIHTTNWREFSPFIILWKAAKLQVRIAKNQFFLYKKYLFFSNFKVRISFRKKPRVR